MSERRGFRQGSKSFSLAARLFPQDTLRDVESLYAWCRHCDDAMDMRSVGVGAREAFEEISYWTKLALYSDIEGLPAPFASLKRIQERHAIDRSFFEDFLMGMWMDAQDGLKVRNEAELYLYCYRVAGVVGLMMASIMGVRGSQAHSYAVALGIGMQMTNVARDIAEDFSRGRVYLPTEWLKELGIEESSLLREESRERLFAVVARLLMSADRHYKYGLLGLRHLPWRSALTIAVAASLYKGIGEKITRLGYVAIDTRVITTRREKVYLFIRGIAWAIAEMSSRKQSDERERPSPLMEKTLWREV